MTTILALDTATTTGFAFGRPGERPTWGAWSSSAPSTGAMLHKFREHLLRLCDRVQPSLVVFEAPYVPRNFYREGPPVNATTLRRLFALAGIVEEVAARFGVECLEAPIGEISKFFLGNARQGGRANKKAATIKMCRLYGWVTDSDDAADALALWAYAEHTIAPRIGSQRYASAGRELPLHGILTAVQEPRPYHEGGGEQHWPVADVDASPVKMTTSEKVKAGVRLTSPEPSSEGGPITRHGGEPRTVRHPP